MPILINSATFTDNFGNSNGFYKGNAGDKFELNFNIASLIRMTSIGNPLTLDASLNQVLSPSVSWLEEGFRVGDDVLVGIYNSGGGLAGPFFTTSITYVDDTMCDFTAMTTWYDLTAGQFIVMVALQAGTSSVKARGELEINFNHIKNSLPSGASSLIDAEVTRAIFQNTNTMTVGSTIVGDLVNKQSGQFLISAELTRNAQQADLFFNHTLKLTFVNSGVYDSAWFFSSECLKAYTKLLWAVSSGEPFAKTEGLYNSNANTGFFDEPNNTSVLDASLIGGVSEIDYINPSTFDIIVDGSLTDMGIGSCYISKNDDYYRNKLLSQTALTMIVPSSDVTASPYSSFQNGDGAGYDLEVNSIGSVGSVHTINVTFTPNPAFQTFMTNVEDGDRLFYLWIKCGNLNLLAFNSQLTTTPPVGGALPMVQDYGYLDHGQNVDTIVGDSTGFIADTEDDIAYLGTFLLDKNETYQQFTVRLEAFNTSTEEDFTLQQCVFSFAGVQYSNDGRYLLNESQSVASELPTTSLKRNAVLVLEPSLDTPTQYGVKIYAPWLLNWRYWIQKQNVNVDFAPEQNENWEQYDNLGDWTIRTELELMKDGLAYLHSNTLTDLDYNSEPYIDSTIEVLQQPLNNVIGVIPIGETVIIKSTHVNLLSNWDPLRVWGMITIESFEASPRWICSSVVPFDNNTNNPLTPISGLLINIDYPTANTAVLTCKFDSNKLNLSNGCKITAKIKEFGDPTLEGVQFQDLELVQFVDGSYVEFQ